VDIKKLKNILEAVLLAADRTLSVVQMEALFELDEERPTRDEIRQALHEMAEDYESRGYELKQVASGYRLQVKQDYATWVGRLWEERPARYTRALLETMALIAYRQPITRGEIEEVRGVSVSSNIIKTLLERDWIKVLGHKDVPGKPSLYGTTKEFLDYFNLKSLDQLPTLAEIKDLDSIHPEFEFDESAENSAEENKEQGDDEANAAESSLADSTAVIDDNVAEAETAADTESGTEAKDEISEAEDAVEEESEETESGAARSAFNV
jgi:segregation and condensation protein B